jgi:hypothetical protein
VRGEQLNYICLNVVALPIRTATRATSVIATDVWGQFVNKSTGLLIGVAVIALAGAGAWLLRPQIGPPEAATVPAVPPGSNAPNAPRPTATPASTPLIAHPLDSPAIDTTPESKGDIDSALVDLFGQRTTLSMFLVDDFARRVAATVDNLGRMHAPARLWPVNPAEGRFTVESRDGVDAIGADNGLRYTPFLLLVETVDLRQLVATYKRLYPRFQQAFEGLGYPGRYFNDRLVEVVDLLLATPEVDGPIRVRLPSINGPVQPERPWVLYEFDDPALQSLAAGQKIMLRMGPVNERRMKARLKEFRRLISAPEQPR